MRLSFLFVCVGLLLANSDLLCSERKFRPSLVSIEDSFILSTLTNRFLATYLTNEFDTRWNKIHEDLIRISDEQQNIICHLNSQAQKTSNQLNLLHQKYHRLEERIDQSWEGINTNHKNISTFNNNISALKLLFYEQSETIEKQSETIQALKEKNKKIKSEFKMLTDCLSNHLNDVVRVKHNKLHGNVVKVAGYVADLEKDQVLNSNRITLCALLSVISLFISSYIVIKQSDQQKTS